MFTVRGTMFLFSLWVGLVGISSADAEQLGLKPPALEVLEQSKSAKEDTKASESSAQGPLIVSCVDALADSSAAKAEGAAKFGESFTPQDSSRVAFSLVPSFSAGQILRQESLISNAGPSNQDQSESKEAQQRLAGFLSSHFPGAVASLQTLFIGPQSPVQMWLESRSYQEYQRHRDHLVELYRLRTLLDHHAKPRDWVLYPGSGRDAAFAQVLFDGPTLAVDALKPFANDLEWDEPKLFAAIRRGSQFNEFQLGFDYLAELKELADQCGLLPAMIAQMRQIVGAYRLISVTRMKVNFRGKWVDAGAFLFRFPFESQMRLQFLMHHNLGADESLLELIDTKQSVVVVSKANLNMFYSQRPGYRQWLDSLNNRLRRGNGAIFEDENNWGQGSLVPSFFDYAGDTILNSPLGYSTRQLWRWHAF